MNPTTTETFYREVFWDFSSSTATLRKGMLRLRVLPDEEHLFAANVSPTAEVDIFPPRPFMDTALAGPNQQSWRSQPIEAASATRLGDQMWFSLPSEVQNAIIHRSDDMAPVLLKIGSSLSGIDEIPWEWLGSTTKQPFGLNPNARLVRSVPMRYAAPPLTIQPPVRVLIVITNPKDERLLDSTKEFQIITGGLVGPNFLVTQLFEPRIEALASALKDEPHILHYVGHAGINHGAGCIILHDETSGTEWISATTLSAMLPASVRLICLSTCVTAQNYQIGGLPRLALASADIPLPTAICNQYPLQPESAEFFWRTFYPALIAKDGSVLEAFNDARNMVSQVAAVGTCDWASFCLVIRDRTGHSFRIGAGARDLSRFASEIQAQFAARLANNLADRVRQYGPNAPEQLKRGLTEAGGTLADITKGLM